MVKIQKHRLTTSRVLARVAGLAGLVLSLALLNATQASAAFEPIATFGEAGEGAQLAASKGMAVNMTGAGNVPKGTVYVVADEKNRVLRYGPRGNFEAAWGWKVSAGASGPGEYERCGPAGEAAHPLCEPATGSPQGEGSGQFSNPVAVAVDQATGDVYVLSGRTIAREHNLVEVFSADGSQIVGAFGELAVFGETFSESLPKIHEPHSSGIAVNEVGTVYLTDRKPASPGSPTEEARVMSFKPQSPGDFSDYVYATGRDISTGGSQIALDDSGNVYVASEEKIFKFAGGNPGQPACEYKIPGGGEQSMTVDPESGEVFFYVYKTRIGRQLSACNAEGQFHELGKFEVLPRTEEVYGLAFNPNFEWDPTRPLGVLYAIDGAGQGVGHIFVHPTAIPPAVESESVSSVTASTALLHARVNPKGSTTHYVFQYISASAYAENPPTDRFAGAAEAPLGGGKLEPGQTGVEVTAPLSGLLPDAEYRYRAVATSNCNTVVESEICESSGAEEYLRTFPVMTAGLPDERAYELVSPTEKHGGEVFPLRPSFASCGGECKPGVNAQAYPRQVSPDGDAIAYEGFAFSPSEGASVYNEYVSRRTASGWTTVNPSPPLMGSTGKGYKAFDPTLNTAVLYQGLPVLSPTAPAEYSNLYLQPTGAPSDLSPLLTSGVQFHRSPGNGSSGLSLVYAGASADLSHVFFEANDALTEATPNAPKAEDDGPAKNNLYEWSGGQLRLVNVAGEATTPGALFGSEARQVGGPAQRVLAHAISTNGTRVFWTGANGQVYVRINGEVTEEIPDTGQFLTAAADGSAVLLNDGHLYNLQTGVLTDLSSGKGGFLGMLGQSEDLTSIYFVDTEALIEGTEAEPGKPNLYLWHEGQTSYIATLAPTDNDTAFGNGPGTGDWEASVAARTAEASPNGRWLAFLSGKELTGYDNNASCKINSRQEHEPGPCFEVFLYDSASGKLICASCNPSGARPLGASSLSVIEGEGSLPQPRYLLDSGRLYFDSQDSLTPADTNGGVEDVYQYEPDEIGSCSRVGGCVSLISAGTGTSDSNFVATDASGENVFFTTRDQLVPIDHDDLVDLYDAREGGGLAADFEAPQAGCKGEACQAQPPPPGELTSTSAEVAGSGPAKSLACKKGQVKRKGHCVKKPRRKKHHRSHKKAKRGAKKAKHGKGGA